MNWFDQAARYAIKIDAAGFLSWLLDPVAAERRFVRWLDTQSIPFPGDPDRRMDTVAEFEHVQGMAAPFALILEVQTRPDPDLDDRLLEYLGRFRREIRHGPYHRDKYDVGAAVLQLTGAGPRTPLTMELPGSQVRMAWDLRVVALRELGAAEQLARVAQGKAPRAILCWIPLMQGGADAEVLTEWRRLATLEPDPRRRSDYGGLAELFAELVDRTDPWKEALEGWNVEQSKVVSRWIEKGVHRGLQQGLEQGLEQGRLVGMQLAVEQVLQARFALPIPNELHEQLQHQSDHNVLVRWLTLASTANSLDEFRANL